MGDRLATVFSNLTLNNELKDYRAMSLAKKASGFVL